MLSFTLGFQINILDRPTTHINADGQDSRGIHHLGNFALTAKHIAPGMKLREITPSGNSPLSIQALNFEGLTH